VKLHHGYSVITLGLAATVASLALSAYAILFPLLLLDDFPLLLHSWTLAGAWSSLWMPHNEHAMPLGRLSTWLVVQLGGGRLTAMPALAALQGPLGLVLGMWLVYVLVGRETGQPLIGLLALIFFGISTQFNQAVTWYSASFVVLALDIILLALLAAQRWQQTRRPLHLAACVLWVALAPGWFASGILAGPLCCLYLLPGRCKHSREAGGTEATARASWAQLPALLASTLHACVPFLGTLLFFGLLLAQPGTAQRIVHSGHYGGQTVFQVGNPLVGLEYTARALVDHLFIGTVGIWDATVPIGVLVPILLGMAVFAVFWWRSAQHRRLLAVGLGFILLSDLLIYTFRASWSYDQMSSWNRYDLLPHAGLTLFLAGGLPQLTRPDVALLSRRQAVGVCMLISILFASQLPRAFGCVFNAYSPEQMPALRRVEEMDARCREHRIAGPTAHEALGRLDLPFDDGTGSGWKFLRGSPDPLPRSVPEARRLLVP
jgi:hypothetical protein